MTRRGLLTAVLLVFVAAAAAWPARFTLAVSMASWLDVGERPRAADYVMVLNGDEVTRPFVAAALMKSGLARMALVAKTPLQPHDVDSEIPPADELVRQVLLKRSIAPGAITVLPGAAATTFDEARALAEFLSERPHARVLVVTDGFHTRRSRWIMDRTLGDRAGQVTVVSAPVDDFDVEHWWRCEEGFTNITAEYFKLGFYWLRYSRFGWWLIACGVLAVVARWARRLSRVGAVPA